VSPNRSPLKKESPRNGGGEVESPNERRERSRSSPENGQVESPGSVGRRDSDGGYDGAESPMHKSRSRSPPAEE
jgi:arginine/serine-rich splicing factor 4/5/6